MQTIFKQMHDGCAMVNGIFTSLELQSKLHRHGGTFIADNLSVTREQKQHVTGRERTKQVNNKKSNESL